MDASTAPAARAHLPFGAVAQRWCDAKRPLVKHSSMCAYRLALRTHLLPQFAAARAIGEADAQAFIIAKIAQGLSKKTVRDMVGVLRNVIRYGFRTGIWGTGDAWQLSYPAGGRTRPLPVLSRPHQARLMGHLMGAPSPRSIGVLIALCAGLRIGEVCALEWADIDLPGRALWVRRTASKVYNCDLGRSERIVSKPKTAHSLREVPLATPLRDALRAVRRAAPGARFVVGPGDQPVDPRGYREYFGRLLRRLQIPPIVFHGLRHTFATRCIESQCDYKTASALLGHANAATTLNLYVHPTLNQKRRAIDRMSRTFGPAQRPGQHPPEA